MVSTLSFLSDYLVKENPIFRMNPDTNAGAFLMKAIICDLAIGGVDELFPDIPSKYDYFKPKLMGMLIEARKLAQIAGRVDDKSLDLLLAPFDKLDLMTDLATAFEIKFDDSYRLITGTLDREEFFHKVSKDWGKQIGAKAIIYKVMDRAYCKTVALSLTPTGLTGKLLECNGFSAEEGGYSSEGTIVKFKTDEDRPLIYISIPIRKNPDSILKTYFKNKFTGSKSDAIYLRKKDAEALDQIKAKDMDITVPYSIYGKGHLQLQVEFNDKFPSLLYKLIHS